MTRIAVTGADGYIGAHVVRALCDIVPDGQVIAVDRKNTKIDTRAIFVKADVLNDIEHQEANALLGGTVDVCIHLAWENGFDHSSASHINNLPRHYDFLRKVIDGGCLNLTVMGSMHEVGYHEGIVDEVTPCNPLSPYGVAKNALRQLIQAYTDDKPVLLKWLRGFYVMGDDSNNRSIFSKIIQFEKEGKSSFPFTDGKSQYDFIGIDNLAKQIARTSIQRDITGIINVCSGRPVALKDMVESFILDNDFKIRPEYGVFPNRKYDSPVIFGDNTKIKRIMAEEIT